LAIETLECRLVLSGSQIDGATWYHEPDGNQYAIISFDELGPSATTQPSRNDQFVPPNASDADVGGYFSGNSMPMFNDFDIETQQIAGFIQSTYLFAGSSPSSIGHDGRPPAAKLLDAPWNGDILSTGLGPLLDENDVAGAAGAVLRLNLVASGAFESLRDRLIDSQVTLNDVKQSSSLTGEFRVGLIVSRPFDEPIEIEIASAGGISRAETLGAGGDSTAEMSFSASAPLTSTDDAASSKTVSEGGSIPLEAIVANVGSGDVAADDGAAIVDWIPKRGESFSTAATADVELIGELARAVAFETIDGEPAPFIYAASESRGGYAVTGEYAIVASGHLMAFPRHELFAGALGDSADDLASRSAANRVELPLAQTAAWFLAALPWTSDDSDLPGDAVADAGRAEAFSRFGEADAVEERLDVAGRSRVWLAAMPVLAVLAAERIVASKKKRERDADRPAKSNSPRAGVCSLGGRARCR
jgi:hypothetical protein